MILDIKLCVFDLDGTVMDTLESIAYFTNFTMKKMGLSVIETEKFKYFAGDGRAKLIHRSLAHNNADTEENFRKACKIYDGEYEGNFLHLSKAFEGIKEMLVYLKNKDIKIAVLSNKPHNVSVSVIENTFGKNFFDYVQGQKTDIPMKPDPESLINIMNQFNVSPDECVMIGDTNVDMQTGINAKCHTMGVLWGFREEKELLENGAEFIVKRPDEILSII